ncbi:MAG: asparagine synthetase B family protein [Solirubrobacterales bacterium]
MSGIAGILRLDHGTAEAEQAERMAARLSRRGADDDGSYRSPDGRLALAVRRLAGTLAPGTDSGQPMANETHDVWMAFDGEVLNHRALRHSLELAGHRFRSGDDCEVALHAYEQWGLDFLIHLQGSFAVALWDDRRDRLVLARDKLGRKPLFFAEDADCLAFASGIDALFVARSRRRTLDPSALAAYLTLGFVPAPATLAAGISKLGPGEILVAERGHRPVRSAWGGCEPEERRVLAMRRLPLDRHAGNLRTLLECSVADRLPGEAPAAVALDPAPESGAVAAIVGRLTGRPAQAVAVMPGDRDGIRDVRLLADAARADLIEVEVTEADGTAAFMEMAAALSEPLADERTLARWFAAREATRLGAGALLSCEGAEAVLLGHPAYQGSRRSRLGLRLARLFGVRMDGGASPSTDPPLPAAMQPFGTEGWSGLAAVDSALPARPAIPYWTDGDPLETVGLTDLRWRVADGLAPSVDAMALANGLEARLPFLDDTFVGYALGIPGTVRSPAGSPRQMRRRILGDLVPAGMAARIAAARAALPVGAWMAGTLGGVLSDLAGRSALVRKGAFEEAHISGLLARHRDGAALERPLWSLAVLLAWADRLGIEGVEAGCRDEAPHLAHSRP